ncbi:RHS repeat domain-containing protein [Treponema pedis]|uniref:RHS repeat domain-containing protein n=1 Tax=Treponema pedis TaxID=409322 RepID=UPI0020915DDD|nr:RHS repeat-associated core domain-containing protein [Treponema pedis]
MEYSYVDKILYDEHSQRVYIKYGNGVETRYKYDEKRRWLDTIETENKQSQDVFQKIKYSFDPVGNVLGYTNEASTYETTQAYKYDNLYQLISVEGESKQYKGKKYFGMSPVNIAKYKQEFNFDIIGNMMNKMSTTNLSGSRGNAYKKADLDYNLDYEYDSKYAHRLIRAGNRYYRYDGNGNITAEKDGPFSEEEEFIFTYNYDKESGVYSTDYGFGLDAPKETEQTNPQDLFAYRRNYTWNERNLLTKSSDKNYTVHYRYGEDGKRALKYTEEGRSETLYFNNFFTIHIPIYDKDNPQGLRVHKHIFVGNSRLVTAMTHTDNHGDNDEQKEKRYYYHSDHLGSAQFVTDWRGKQYEHIEYTPYGELWIEETAPGIDKLPFRFTGKELDEETGLYYYGARYLDPKYSRWLSGDPALNDYIPKAPIDDEAKKHNENLPGMGGVYNTVNLHVYHYAGNNPVKYIDPDGRFLEVSDNGDGTYTVSGGKENSDKNIYLTVNGQRTGDIIGVMFTEHSFFNGGKVVAGAVINPNDSSGQEFLNDFKENTPSLFSYIPGGLNGKKYDFKDIGIKNGDNQLIYHHRGMPLGVDKNGSKIFGTARDVGNYAAGYIAGKKGLSWGEARFGFDALQSAVDSFRARSITRSTEGPESRAAQYKGFIDGKANFNNVWKNLDVMF